MRIAAWFLAFGMAAGGTGQPAERVAPPTVEDLAWLAGHWRGEGFGGTVEEIWSRPLGGTMVGTFRLVKDGEVQFYEINVLRQDGDRIVMKVKHFSADFVAWEEKDDAVDFPLESLEGQSAKFGGLTIERKGDALDIRIRMRSKDGSTRWEPLSFRAYRP